MSLHSATNTNTTSKPASNYQGKDETVASESLLQDVAKQLLEWRFLGRELGINEGMLHNIECDCKEELERKYQTLLRWKHKSSSEATIGRLANALRKVDRTDLADKVEGNLHHNPGNRRKPVLDKQEIFIQQLKRRYKVLYHSIKPLPYLKDMTFCVDNVFIEGKIERRNNDERGNEIWQPMDSYHDILLDLKTETNRCVILGEPGYGKSTLALQFLYDWCNQVPESHLKDVNIVIFFRMRQLGGFTSIHEAIKGLLLPKDSIISVGDIKLILQASKSTIIFFDGYDEYPDKRREGTDFADIIKMKMFDDKKVIVSSRLSKLNQLPDELRTQSTQVQLRGFELADRCSYILKAVVCGNTEEGKDIIRQLTQNSFLHDMFQIPLFFTIVSHTAKDKKNIIPSNKTVTWFFRFILECFFKNTKNKGIDYSLNNRLQQVQCPQLGKLLFEGLSKADQQISWDKVVLLEEVDDMFYNNLIASGILIEEEVACVAERVDEENFFQDKTIVTFYHKLFCEWYAAQYLIDRILHILDFTALRSSVMEVIYELLANADTDDLQYMFRFASGWNPKVGCLVIEYLVKQIKNMKLATLCLLEYTGNDEDIIGAVIGICSNPVQLREYDSMTLHRAVIHLLQMASRCDVLIAELSLTWSFREFDGVNIKLDSGLVLTPLSSLEKLFVNGDGQKLSQEEVVGLISFCVASRNFRELWLNNCILPSIRTDRLPEISASRDVKVMSSDGVSCFDFHSGEWKTPKDLKTISRMCSSSITIHNQTSVVVQRSVIELLTTASQHNIRIDSLSLIMSFKAVDTSGHIILNTGLSLPILKTVENIMIQAETGREMSEDEVHGILHYVVQSQKCKMLILHDCLLPWSIPTNESFSSLQSQSVDVVWVYVPKDCKFQLDLTSGKWLATAHGKVMMSDEEYRDEVERYRELFRDYPWQKARRAR